MNEKKPKQKLVLREAGNEDIPILALHHRKMFEEIGENKGEPIDITTGRDLEKAYARKLGHQISDGSCRAWVIADREHIVASGAVSIVSFVPMPYDLSSDVIYLHSMFTEKDYRGRRCANRIIEEAIRYCKANGLKRIFLSASAAGKPVYENIGFVSIPEMMRLDIT
ncbi:MAG: GNAT family N-acetyltransferase [Deltaproteobacteria bacterium]|nr:GNAT family N-acetyltransferase [Deltaproteobacteria bacterium]